MRWWRPGAPRHAEWAIQPVGEVTQTERSVIHSDPEILGGTPVFWGTRVPVQALMDYLEPGEPLDAFLDHFPSVNRQQAVAALELAKQMLIAHANSA